MQLSSTFQYLMALAAVAPAALATPVGAPTSAKSFQAPGFLDPITVQGSLGKRSFAKSCEGCKYGKKFTDFHCECRNSAGDKVPSYLNLDNCLANAQGHPVWRRNGGLSGSCKGTSMGKAADGKSFQYSTYCETGKGDSIPDWIDLNKRIHNDNGRLWCDV
ncbi:Cyanovirin-N [Rhypophila sp. PSN 637]